ncbi:hypothetical protein [Nocardia acidivorans]|uniref:hypothetical protein n=1 Tax=Nocardia acidivorans TaxID=404580 RepID=UPI0012FCE28F|nr:hypothetical protein [Nocardia acidivorans]
MRRILGDTAAVLVGILFGCLIVAGAIGALLYCLHDAMTDSTWAGEVPFVADCPAGSPCTLTSVREQTPRQAVGGKTDDTISSVVPPGLENLRTGDHVVCTVHRTEFGLGRSPNDLESATAVDNCHRP